MSSRYAIVFPTAFYDGDFARNGGLLAYGTPDTETASNAVRSADYVDRILRGTKAADLPVYTPSRYELVLNLRKAKALNLTIPHGLPLRADEIIQ